ncbi:RDD family protein [Brevundimonas sp. 2R-24]|uniref:RDD family protein n=1 Tax=Peiella sedimenti TaxID=3061083 RepID=A0ABT8SHK8_9CAUL|nr:RDD family protein [Caulobacteraceae bacterium XZ-24]
MTSITAPEATHTHAWTATAPRPWRRFFGRWADGVVLGSILWFSISMATYLVDPLAGDRLVAFLYSAPGRLLESLMTLVLVAPFSALLISLTGGTPGKWMFGVRIARPDGRRISYGEALGREFQVIVRGYGLAIPIVALVMLWRSKERLESTGRTVWDPKAKRTVTYRNDGPWQTVLLWVGGVTVVLLVIALQVLARMPV